MATHKLLERLGEHLRNIVALNVGRTEALGPADKLCGVSVSRSDLTHLRGRCVPESRGTRTGLLAQEGRRTTNSKAKRKVASVLVAAKGVDDEVLQALGTEVEAVRLAGQRSTNTYSFWPSSCFCSSVRRYLVCVTSNLPSPWRVTRQTRRLVPPRSTARYSPFSSPPGHCNVNARSRDVSVNLRQRRR